MNTFSKLLRFHNLGLLLFLSLFVTTALGEKRKIFNLYKNGADQQITFMEDVDEDSPLSESENPRLQLLYGTILDQVCTFYSIVEMREYTGAGKKKQKKEKPFVHRLFLYPLNDVFAMEVTPFVGEITDDHNGLFLLENFPAIPSSDGEDLYLPIISSARLHSDSASDSPSDSASDNQSTDHSEDITFHVTFEYSAGGGRISPLSGLFRIDAYTGAFISLTLEGDAGVITPYDSSRRSSEDESDWTEEEDNDRTEEDDSTCHSCFEPFLRRFMLWWTSR
ncbi:hypothetical protein [Endozoicomonas lisbonensis]|uniref:Uncharacterized protein n=1 Tax=Endozoicomonas lisbonensis TaxID=3120522 RepID=A0ABV2SC87_9GAMM